MPRHNTMDSFWERVDKTGSCWLWTGHLQSGGYGQMRLDGYLTLVHRIAYQAMVGPVPAGLQLDHLCRVRRCVNPDHLEPVTNRENVLRGAGITAQNAKKTHCKRGHAFDLDNTRWSPGGGRACGACQRMKAAASRARKAAALARFGAGQ